MLVFLTDLRVTITVSLPNTEQESPTNCWKNVSAAGHNIFVGMFFRLKSNPALPVVCHEIIKRGVGTITGHFSHIRLTSMSCLPSLEMASVIEPLIAEKQGLSLQTGMANTE